MSFMRNLEAALEAAGRSKADLARHLKITTQAISQWKDPAGAKRLLTVADFCAVPVDYLLRGSIAGNVKAMSPPTGPGVPAQGPHTKEEFALIEMWRELEQPEQALAFDILDAAVRSSLRRRYGGR
jgi:hypothetical protein